METYRARINQPSAFDPLHNLNGEYCIVQDTGEATVRAWFTKGAVHSMEIPRVCLSRIRLSKAG